MIAAPDRDMPHVVAQSRLPGLPFSPAVIAQADEETSPGATPQDKVKHVLSLLGGLADIVQPGASVLLKPNFVAPFPQAATAFAVIEAVVEEVRACGGTPIIAEAAGFEFDTESTFELLGVRRWAEERGVRLLNLDREPFVHIPTDWADTWVCPYGDLEISRWTWEADVVINLPKLKQHSLTRVTLGMKNLMGLLSRDSRRLLHVWGLERGIIALAQIVRPQLTILDALTATTRAVFGQTRYWGAIIGGRDMLAVDHYACRLLGENPKRITHIREAQRRGLGTAEYQVLGGKELLLPIKASKESWRKRLFRAVFQGMFAADLLYTRAFPGRSLIPAIHYWLGIRPQIEKSACDRCGVCAATCPLNAIDAKERKIIATRCMHLRCLRCLEACPRHAIVLRDWRHILAR